MPILVYPTLHYQNGGLEITPDGMTAASENLFVAGEAVGGIHGRNRLMGNSLLDIIVFGRNAGQHAAAHGQDRQARRAHAASMWKNSPRNSRTRASIPTPPPRSCCRTIATTKNKFIIRLRRDFL